MQNIRSAADAIFAPEHLIDANFEVMRQEPSAINIMSAIKASKLLAQHDIAETRRQVQDFYDATSILVREDRHEEYKRTLFILFNMADASVRLALMLPRQDAADVLD